MTSDIGGVWRTIGGRRVFIKDGQDLSTAMKESGKFKLSKKQIEAGNKLNENAKRGAEEDIKEYLKGNVEEWDNDEDFIRDVSNEWGLEQKEVKKIFENIKNSKGKYSVDYFKNKGIEIKNNIPNGYIKLEGATTAPKGYEWYFNGKSRFGGEYKSILVKKEK